MRSWVEVSLGQIRANYRAVRKVVGSEIEVMAVVKADAYRHGAPEVARALEAEGANWLAVSNVDEGVYLSTRVVALGRPPATVAIDLPIELPHPRDQITTRALPEYLDYRGRLLAQLFAEEGLATRDAA